MKKVKHISSEQLGRMVGDQLGSKLWLNGMLNEIRRYPNLIPCDRGEIPSMLIPFESGDQKVEWGFTAGMSCLVPIGDGRISVRHAEQFPASASLALLSLLYDAGAASGKKVNIKLMLPYESDISAFRSNIASIQEKMANVKIDIVFGGSAEQPAPEANRKVFSPRNSIAVVHKLQQIDVGRFVALVQCINGVFSVGDDITITDGSYNVKQTHCPVLGIDAAASDGPESTKSSEELDEDIFWLSFAMWFPEGQEMDGMRIVKEQQCEPFVPEEMPPRPSLTNLSNSKPEVTPTKPSSVSQSNSSKGFFKKLFG